MIKKIINNREEVIANKSIISHTQLRDTNSYNCHPISAIKDLPEKLRDLKEEDKAQQLELDNINNDLIELNKEIENIDLNKDGNELIFTNSKSEIKKFIDAGGYEPDNETIGLNKDSKLEVINKVDNESLVTEANIIKAKGLIDSNNNLHTIDNINSTIEECNININSINEHLDKVDTSIDTINSNVDSNNKEIRNLNARVKGVGGYLTANDFGSNPSQNDLTAYALQQIGITDEKEIYNQTKVKNLNDGNIWVLTNTPETDIFEWTNVGTEYINTATNDGVQGIVTGSYDEYEGFIDVLGHISINGLREKVENKQDTLTAGNNISIDNNTINTKNVLRLDTNETQTLNTSTLILAKDTRVSFRIGGWNTNLPWLGIFSENNGVELETFNSSGAGPVVRLINSGKQALYGANNIKLYDEPNLTLLGTLTFPTNKSGIFALDVDLADKASLSEENTFTGKQNFNSESIFNAISHHTKDVEISNGVLKILDSTSNGDGSTKDIVTQYNADKIISEIDSNVNEFLFPKESGTLITDKLFGIKYSSFINSSDNSSKSDTWKTTDIDTTLSMIHESGDTFSTVNVSKNYATLSTIDNSSGSAKVTATSDTVLITAQGTEEEQYNVLKVSPTEVLLNNQKLLIGSDIENKLDKVTTTGNLFRVYTISKDGNQTLTNIDEVIDNQSTNLVNNKTIAEALEGKINTAPSSVVSVAYVKNGDGDNTTVSYSYAANGNTIAYRSPGGTLAVETPTQTNDATNKSYVDTELAKKQNTLTAGSRIVIDSNNVIKAVTNYIELSGEDGTIDDDQYTMLQGDPMTVIKRASVYYKLNSSPINGSGDYVFISDYYDTGEIESYTPYIIVLKQDKTWTWKALTSTNIQEQTIPEYIEITPASATNGNLTEEQYSMLLEHKSVKIKLNNEYYSQSDDDHTPGLLSYSHLGWNGSASQTKSINITKETKAWTLVIGKNKYYRHYIQLQADGKAFYYDFSSTQETAYTASTLPAMPDDIITAIQVVTNGYYSSVSGLVYRNSENTLKIIVHGMYTTDGTNMTYLQLTGVDATFISDTIITQ